ncbi:hypothetical protein QN277_027127 [Acacia crassicarpa]|uniref:C2H2-type domain-containing protein n=1 Tax=Acacia crassicarpa TaxID=499986 RepID=A0AAE1K5H4_9FABA|nr:hypothetical protein QN277_027127 [Acacia crassicarpa]
MANRGWNSRNHLCPPNNEQIACRLCNHVFPNREIFIAHIDSHLARDEFINNHGNNNIQILPKASHTEAFRSYHHQLAVMPNNNLPVIRASTVSNNLQQVNRNVFEAQPPPVAVPEVNRNGFDAPALMQKVTRNDFNNFPLVVQEGNNRINVANNAQTFSWTSQPRPTGPPLSSGTPLVPRRNPGLLTYVPPSPPAGSLQPPPQLGFSSMTRRNNSTRGGAARHRSQQRNVEMVAAAATTEPITKRFIDMLETPIKKVDFVDLEDMDVDGDGEESAGGSGKKLDLSLKL